jgi:hypothetical protein
MRPITAYKTEDGRVFADRREAIVHEAGMELDRTYEDIFTPILKSSDGAAVRKVLTVTKTDLDTARQVRDALTRYIQRVAGKSKPALAA